MQLVKLVKMAHQVNPVLLEIEADLVTLALEEMLVHLEHQECQVQEDLLVFLVLKEIEEEMELLVDQEQLVSKTKSFVELKLSSTAFSIKDADLVQLYNSYTYLTCITSTISGGGNCLHNNIR